jgi:hypothetical protein
MIFNFNFVLFADIIKQCYLEKLSWFIIVPLLFVQVWRIVERAVCFTIANKF